MLCFVYGDILCINFIFYCYHSLVVCINLDMSIVTGSDNKDTNKKNSCTQIVMKRVSRSDKKNQELFC